MRTIDIIRFISCPAYLFELQGILPLGDDAGVPCRIRMGQRRFVTVLADPDKLGLLACYPTEDGRMVYIPCESIDVKVNARGVLSIDAESLVRKHFGDDYSLCDSLDWRWEKNRLHSGVVHSTSFGTAVCARDGIAPCSFQSTLYFAPDALTLCGQNVRYISWAIDEEAYSACGAAFLPLIETALQGRHTCTMADAFTWLQAVNTPAYTRLDIRTDRGSFIVNPAAKYLILLSGDGEVSEGYKLSDDCYATALVQLLLQLLQASSAEEVREVLDRNHRLGLLSKQK